MAKPAEPPTMRAKIRFKATSTAAKPDINVRGTSNASVGNLPPWMYVVRGYRHERQILSAVGTPFASFTYLVAISLLGKKRSQDAQSSYGDVRLILITRPNLNSPLDHKPDREVRENRKNR